MVECNRVSQTSDQNLLQNYVGSSEKRVKLSESLVSLKFKGKVERVSRLGSLIGNDFLSQSLMSLHIKENPGGYEGHLCPFFFSGTAPKERKESTMTRTWSGATWLISSRSIQVPSSWMWSK